MSRLAKKPIFLPKDVSFSLKDGSAVVYGPKGEAKFFVHENVEIKHSGDELLVVPKTNNQKNTKALLGTIFSLLKNSIKGVTDGFEKKLEIEGIGYKAQLEGDTLSLSLGFTHPVKVKAPKGISFKVEKNVITVSGANKEVVGQITSTIRLKKPPEPYKGKGIHYLGEVIRKKAGKKAVGTA